MLNVFKLDLNLYFLSHNFQNYNIFFSFSNVILIDHNVFNIWLSVNWIISFFFAVGYFLIRFLNIAIKHQLCNSYYGTQKIWKIMTTKCVFNCNQILEGKCLKSSIFYHNSAQKNNSWIGTNILYGIWMSKSGRIKKCSKQQLACNWRGAFN